MLLSRMVDGPASLARAPQPEMRWLVALDGPFVASDASAPQAIFRFGRGPEPPEGSWSSPALPDTGHEVPTRCHSMLTCPCMHEFQWRSLEAAVQTFRGSPATVA